MHIPDGYLGPQTYVPAFAVMVALWTAGIARVKRTLRRRAGADARAGRGL